MAKRSSKQPSPKPTGEYWVIDTDTPGQSEGQFSSSGPFVTFAEAEAFIINDALNLCQDACTCLTFDKKHKWSKPLHIVQVRRTVQPEITPKVTLLKM